MKKTLIFAALMAVATLIGCKNNSDDNPSGDSISVSPVTLSVSGYSNSNEVTVTSNGAWTALSDATWVTLSAANGNGNTTVTLMVEENPLSASRSAEITFTSGEATATLLIGQAAAGTAGNSFSLDIKVSNVTAISADIAFTPSEENQEYIYFIGESGDMESLYSDDAEIMAAVIDTYIYYGSLEDFITSGSESGTFSGLTPSTDYTIYAFSINAPHTAPESDLFTANFTTVTAEVTDQYNAWLGTWTLTSTASELDGGSLSLEVIITDNDDIAYPGVTYSIYGWDVSAARYYYPLPATFNSSTNGFSVSAINDVADDGTYLYEYIGRALIEGGYYIMGDYFDALYGTMDSGNQSGAITGTEGTFDGVDYLITNVVLRAIYDGAYYRLTNDTSLGFQTYEALVGPFTLTKISNDETVPVASAPQLVPGFENIEKQIKAIKGAKELIFLQN
ncbi:MAG: BACON domain-containing protein [Rikenellaceae bacterium]